MTFFLFSLAWATFVILRSIASSRNGFVKSLTWSMENQEVQLALDIHRLFIGDFMFIYVLCPLHYHWNWCKAFNNSWYSKTFVQRPPLRLKKVVRCWQVVVVQRYYIIKKWYYDKSSKWDLKMVVVIDRWLEFGVGGYFIFDWTSNWRTHFMRIKRTVNYILNVLFKMVNHHTFSW
jgi:hypothetical protein